MHRRLARTALFVALAASSVACTKTLDTTSLQTQLQAQLQSQLGAQNLTVHCPDSVKVQAGATFTCTASDRGGQSLTILITQKDDHGHVRWNFSGASGASSTSPAASPSS